MLRILASWGGIALPTPQVYGAHLDYASIMQKKFKINSKTLLTLSKTQKKNEI
jgi:hypothetical protein